MPEEGKVIFNTIQLKGIHADRLEHARDNRHRYTELQDGNIFNFWFADLIYYGANAIKIGAIVGNAALHGCVSRAEMGVAE